MADNYDEVIDQQFGQASAPARPAAPADPYDSVIDEMAQSQKVGVQQSMRVAADKDPDRQAKVLDLSKRMNLPAAIVEKNYDDLARKAGMNHDYDRMLKDTPGLSQFLQDENNAALVKDDLPAMAKVEQTVRDHGMLSKLYNSLGAGLAGLNASISKVPALIYDAAALPQNMIYSAIGRDTRLSSDQTFFGRKNALTAKYEADAQAFRAEVPELDQSIIGEIKSGNYQRAGQVLAAQFVANGPQQAALMLGMMTGYGEASLLGAGVTSAADKNAANLESGVDPAVGVPNALATGALEAGLESVGTFGILKKWEGLISKQWGREVSREVMKDFAKTLLYSVASEGNEEAVTSLAQDFTDYVSGVNPDALKGMGQRAGDAFILGGVSGGGMTAPGGILSGVAQAQNANRAKNFYLSLGQSAEATKLRERLPEAQRQFVENVVKDSPVENIYIDVGAAEQYFEQSGLNPTKVMQDLGVLDAYSEAKATGGDIKIPLGTWVEKVVGTEHYTGLANDIRFNQDGLSVNEAKAQEAEQREKLEAEAAAATPKEAKPDPAAQIGIKVTEQLETAGFDRKTAETYAKLYESAFKTLGERAGVDAGELFNRYGLQITKGGVPATDANTEEEAHYQTVLEQSNLDYEAVAGTNVVDAASAFRAKTEDAEAARGIDEDLQKEERKRQKEAIKLVGKTLAASISPEGLDQLARYAARFPEGDKKGEKAIKAAQREDAGPYVNSPAIAGVGWIPNFAAKPTGVIGPARISQPHVVDYSKGVRGAVNGNSTVETDPLKWSDNKFKATQELIRKHATAGIPLTINTSSDLIAHDEYINILPPGTIVNIYAGTSDEQLNRALFPGNPSRLRQERAYEKLRGAGVRVKLVEPSFEDVVDAVGGAAKVESLFGEGWSEALRAATRPKLTVLQQSSVDDASERKKQEIAQAFSAEEALEQYAAIPETEGGTFIDTDTARGLYEPYTQGREGAILNSELTDEPAGRFAARVYEQRLARPGAGVDDPVLILAGGSGSGKTRYRQTYAEQLKGLAAVFDSTSANYTIAKQRIEQALATGRPVLMTYLYRPFDLALEGNAGRFKETGRFVQPHYMAYSHVNSLDTFLKLADEYRDNPMVSFEAFDNSQDSIKPMPLEKLETLRYNQPGESLNVAVKRLKRAADKRLSNEQEEVRSVKEQAAKRAAESAVAAGFASPSSEGGGSESPDSSGQGGTTLNQGPRGQIRFGGDRKFSIELMESADLSTFLHETGHFYLEVLADLAAAEGAAPDIHSDFQTILNWLGVESREDLQREHHEQFARGFEAYLMEGKAPTSALRKAFARFKIWLLTVYRDLQNLQVNLTPEVRGVMDRLLSTQEEIDLAMREQSMDPLFTEGGKIKMSEEQAKRYDEALADAREAAEEEVQAKILAEYTRERETWWKEARAAFRKEVTDQINASSLYKAISILQKGKYPDGSPLPQGVAAIKLSKDAIVETYGKEFLKRLPRPYVYAREGGLHYDVAAQLLGFESGEQMLTAIANAPKREDLIEQVTDQKMSEKYPDMRDDGRLKQAAMDAVHNESRSKLLRLELEYLLEHEPAVVKDAIRRVAKRIPTDKMVREQAEQIISRKTIKEVGGSSVVQNGKRKMTASLVTQFQRAERKAAKEAGELLAKGNIEGAFEAKSRERLNHELYRAALNAQEQVDRALEMFKRIAQADDKLAKSRDMDLVNAARAVLAQFGLATTDKSALDYLEPIRKYDPDAYETVTALFVGLTEQAGNYKGVSIDTFLTMRDSVMGLWDLSKASKQIEIDGKALDREAITDELKSQVGVMVAPAKLPGYTRQVSTWDKAKLSLMGMRAALRRVESWVDAIDGGEINGPFRKYIWNPISEGASRYREDKKVYLQRYLDIVKGIEKSLTHKEIAAPELAWVDSEGVRQHYTFSGKAELLGALLHTGNESNLSKLLRGRKWGNLDANENLDTSQWDMFIRRMIKEGVLTKADYDYAQAVWDLLEDLKAPAQRAHKKMYGHYFNEITATPIQTPFGTYRGGYVPAVADPFIATDAQIREEKAALEQGGNSFMFPTTGRGFTKKRIEAYARPLAIDARLVPGHIDKVLRFVHIEPHVKEVGRIVMDRGFRETLDQIDPAVGGDMLVPWLQRSATQRVQTPMQGLGGRGADAFFRELRKRTGINVMAANVVNTLQQFTGLSVAAVKVHPKFLRNALWAYTRAPGKTAEDVAAKSEFMRGRVSTQVMEVQSTLDDLLLNPTNYEKAREFAAKHGYFMQSATQNIVDTITWAAAYDQAVDQGLSERDAVRAADAAVRLTQGSFAAEDSSRFETGTAFARAFTMFYSYFNMLSNLIGSEFAKIIRTMGLKKGAGRALYVYTFGFMIPSVLSEVIVRAMGPGFDADDDDNYLDDAMVIFFGSQLRTATAMFPFVGPTVQAGINAWNDKWYDDRISTSPAIAMIESAVKAPHSVYKAIADDGSKKTAIRDTLSAVGLLTGLPVAPLSRPLGYISDVSDNKVRPTGPVDFARGLVTGKSGQPSSP